MNNAQGNNLKRSEENKKGTRKRTEEDILTETLPHLPLNGDSRAREAAGMKNGKNCRHIMEMAKNGISSQVEHNLGESTQKQTKSVSRYPFSDDNYSENSIETRTR